MAEVAYATGIIEHATLTRWAEDAAQAAYEVRACVDVECAGVV